MRRRQESDEILDLVQGLRVFPFANAFCLRHGLGKLNLIPNLLIILLGARDFDKKNTRGD